MKLYNSKTNSLEEFKSITPMHVDMYVCGPTVYNHPHIGNARPMIVFDTLRRLFEVQGYTVSYVSNYTDVDDKIINKALNEELDEITISTRYIDAYQAVRDSLNVKPLTATPKVTENMPEIISFIKELLDKEYAYVVDGDVYFRVTKIEDYGCLSKQNIDDLQVGARIEENSKKENPLDFALWKTTDMGIRWDTPWGKGRPGWHTECVVMINKVFDSDHIDIHGGGMDLKFPHHENELAQSQALHHSQLANYWLHNGMLNFDGEKMSKSLGNVVWAKDFISEYGSNVIRWLMLSAHYRAPLNISEQTINTAKTELERVLTALRQAEVAQQRAKIIDHKEIDEKLLDRFVAAMNEDINTPNGFMEIFETIKILNKALREKDVDWQALISIKNALLKMIEVIGISYQPPILTIEDLNNFEQWDNARKAKNFELADIYRKTLSEKGLL
ncbi:MAG: cysteine--tRNA ligase [Erysipelotrichaceae bacterium]|nr:cysteine--tRNA ligase [Erysipelotrichaceae bacterium]